MSITLVAWTGLVTMALIVGVIVQLIVARLVAGSRRRSLQAFERVWLPVLFQAMEATPDALPPMARRHALRFLSVWNRLQESLLGDSKERLNEVARRTGMADLARHMLADGNLSDRLLAIATLGHLRDFSVRARLLQLVRERDPSLSLVAARALVQIDAPGTIQPVLALVAARDDWPPSAVGRLLQEAGPDVISGPLVQTVVSAPPERAHLLIRHLGLAHPEAFVPVVRQLVHQSDNVETLTACLRVFNDASDLDTVRGHLAHPRWEVRVQAVNTIARMGTADDEARLIALLSDREWWVRYRAAQALCALPSADLPRLERVGATHEDRYARDIMAHVLSERRAA